MRVACSTQNIDRERRRERWAVLRGAGDRIRPVGFVPSARCAPRRPGCRHHRHTTPTESDPCRALVWQGIVPDIGGVNLPHGACEARQAGLGSTAETSVGVRSSNEFVGGARRVPHQPWLPWPSRVATARDDPRDSMSGGHQARTVPAQLGPIWDAQSEACGAAADSGPNRRPAYRSGRRSR